MPRLLEFLKVARPWSVRRRASRVGRRGPSATLTFATLAAWLATALAGCGTSGSYVWVQRLASADGAAGSSDEYVIAPGDMLSIRVYEQEGLSTKLKVRADGRIALPLVGEVQVGGKRPSVLSRELDGLFKQFINAPRVTVNVDEYQALTLTVTGGVMHPGLFTFPHAPTVLEALANAGNFTEDADRSAIFVLRRFPSYVRIRFEYDMLIHNERPAAGFLLHAGDVLVVE